MRNIIGLLGCLFIILGCMTIVSNHNKQNNTRYDGTIVVTEKDGVKVFSLELDTDPQELDKQESVTFKVMSAEPSLEE